MNQPGTYLQTDQSGAFTEQITRLLRDKDSDNCPLLLELIEGGGANRRLLGYLFGIAVFHHMPGISGRAMALLQRFASETTVQQATKLRESVAYHYDEAEYFSRYQSDEIDLFDLLLANKMCLWHRNASANGNGVRSAFETLDLGRLTARQLSPAITTLNFLKYIALPAHKDFELPTAIPLLQHLPLEVVIIENIRIDTFPAGIFALPNLQTLIIRKGERRPRNPMQVPDSGPLGSASLVKLVIDAYPVHGAEKLGPFPNLREANLTRCQISGLELLAQSRRLEQLDASHNRLESLPEFLSECRQLHSLKLSGNPFRHIALNLEQMTQLEDLEIKMQFPVSGEKSHSPEKNKSSGKKP